MLSSTSLHDDTVVRTVASQQGLSCFLFSLCLHVFHLGILACMQLVGLG